MPFLAHWNGAVGKSGVSLDFAGGSWLAAPSGFDAISLTTFAFSVSVRLDALGGNLFNGEGAITGSLSIINLSNGRLRMLIRETEQGSTGTLLQTVAGTVTAGQWHHLYFLYDSTQLTPANRAAIYVDGALASYESAFYPALNEPCDDYGSNFRVGSFGSGADGKLFQPAAFSGTLPPVSSLYASGVHKPVSGLSGLFSLLNGANGNVESDALLSDWTKNGTVELSPVIP